MCVAHVSTTLCCCVLFVDWPGRVCLDVFAAHVYACVVHIRSFACYICYSLCARVRRVMWHLLCAENKMRDRPHLSLANKSHTVRAAVRPAIISLEWKSVGGAFFLMPAFALEC